MTGRLVWKVTEVADLRGDRLLVLQGELDIGTAPELSAMLTRLRVRNRSVVLDLADVTFMDSTGLTLLMDAWIDGERDGWAFSVRAASPAVRRVFTLAGVERLIDGA
jgi:anti-sigma B factor antagonist